MERSGGLPVRLVTKSVRSVAVLRYVLDASATFQGLLCFSAAEAAWLAGQGFDDLVVAYPTVEPADVTAAAHQIAAGRNIVLMVDHPDQIAPIAAAARAAGAEMPLAIDIDVSTAFPMLHFGVRRSPITRPDQALALAEAIARAEGVSLAGAMGYEGQIAGVMDDVPGQGPKNRLIRSLKRRSIRNVRARRGAIVAALTAAGHRLRFVNGGGTGSFESTRADPSVTELAAGSGLYNPVLFDHYRGFKLHPAAGFALPVTRQPAPGTVTCSGGGYIASGPAGADRLPQPWLPPGGRLLALEGAGEVQTPVDLPGGATLPIGAPYLFRHAKAGELCERFSTLLLLRGGAVERTVTTYRGDGQCFL